MQPWLIWIGHLVAAIIAFLQANPFPQHRPTILRPIARIAYNRQAAAAVQAAPAAHPATQRTGEKVGALVQVRLVRALDRRECTGRSCAIVRYEWRERSDEPRRHYLYRQGVQIGAWCYDRCLYMAYNPAIDRWGPPEASPPVEVPGIEEKTRAKPQSREETEEAASEVFIDTPVGAAAGEVPNFGINTEKLPKPGGEHVYAINGVRCDRKRAFEAMGSAAAGPIPDDRDCLRVTCVGADGRSCASLIRQDLDRAALQAWKDKIVIQDYASEDVPILNGLGFIKGVHVQSPSGMPLWFCTDYDADKFAAGLQLADARRKDNAWDPMHWPDLAKPALAVDPAPAPPIAPPQGSVQWWWTLVAALVGFLAKYFHGQMPLTISVKPADKAADKKDP